MIMQFIFFGLFIMALFAGLYSHFAPKAVNPLAFVMDKSGYSEVQTIEEKKTREVNLTTKEGVMQVRREMEDISRVQNNFMDALHDQREILKNARTNASQVLLAAKKGGMRGPDVLQLEALSSQIDDAQRLAVTHGQQLVALNDQISDSRKLIADQIDYANISTDAMLDVLKRRNSAIKGQLAELYSGMGDFHRQMHDAMERMQGKVEGLSKISCDNKNLERMIREQMWRMLRQQRENMMRLAEIEERNKEQIRDAQQNLADNQQRLEDLEQHTKDLIADSRQRTEDQQDMIRRRIEDQRNR